MAGRPQAEKVDVLLRVSQMPSRAQLCCMLAILCKPVVLHMPGARSSRRDSSLTGAAEQSAPTTGAFVPCAPWV